MVDKFFKYLPLIIVALCSYLVYKHWGTSLGTAYIIAAAGWLHAYFQGNKNE